MPDDQQKPEADIEQMRTAETREMKLLPQKTWFFKRTSGKNAGEIFPTQEGEAWSILNERSDPRRPRFELIGVSSGETFVRLVKESKAEATKLEPEIERLKKQITAYKTQEDKLILEDIIDMDGDVADAENEKGKQKVLRIRTLVAKLEPQLEDLQTQYRRATSEMVKKAMDAELEIARGNIEMPGAMNILTPHAQGAERQKILRAMGQA